MAPPKERVGVIGATSIIGEYLLPLLVDEGYGVVAFSRRVKPPRLSGDSRIEWRLLPGEPFPLPDNTKYPPISSWVSLGPITALSCYFSLLSVYGAIRVVALSSTSLFTKHSSSDAADRKATQDLADHEELLKKWAQQKKIVFTILRPTMIYGKGRDKNISLIAAFVRRLPFFCIYGTANGLRNPLHAEDAALFCLSALKSAKTVNQTYNITGGEEITYREMVSRVFAALGKKPRFLRVPLAAFRLAFGLLSLLPSYRRLTVSMAARMNQNMVFDHRQAVDELGIQPRPFRPDADDLNRGKGD